MLSNNSIVRSFLVRQNASAKHLYTDGSVLYSYGTHFPIAAWAGNTLLVNQDKYSVTSSCHQRILSGQVHHQNQKMVFVTTEELKQHINSRSDVVLLIRNPETWKENLDGLLECLKKMKVHKSRRDKVGEVVQEAIARVTARML